MRKSLPLLSLIMLSMASMNAQEVDSTDTGYNRWSIEVNGGVNKPTRTMTPGYYTKTLNMFHADLGVRYMLNPKFGMKLDFGYDKFKDGKGSAPFESTYLRTSLQGVVNIGRVLNFETWTNTIGLLAHGGFGVSQLTSKDGFDGEDYAGNGILGLTGQIKLTKSIVLTGDLTGIINGKQNNNFDGMSQTTTSAFDGIILNASAGFTFYLGSHSKHADWVTETEASDELSALEKRVGLIETGLVDSDKDGVADLYDLEPNSIGGVAVNTKGQAVDNNKNGVPDELEGYLEKTYGPNSTTTTTNGSTIEELINDGYVNVYFGFDSAQPTTASLSGIDFLVKYLKANPSKNAEIVGYADEVGDSSYNRDLSQRRAETVKNITTSAGINASRLTVIANGEDNSVNKDSKEARQIVRRVTFRVK
jgi:OOP family OmpA-OmpF porin